MEANGTFSIGITLASALAVPATGIFILYAPIISNYIKNNQISELDLKYKEISKLLFFIGALLYSCIFLGINNLFMLSLLIKCISDQEYNLWEQKFEAKFKNNYSFKN